MVRRLCVAQLGMLLSVGLTLVACGGKTRQSGLEITIATSGLQPGNDFDALEATVEQQTPAGWNLLFHRMASLVSVPPEVTLPTTLAIVVGTSPDQLAHIEVTATRQGVPVVQRVIETQVPSDRVEPILVVLDARCFNEIDLCLPGSCQPNSGQCGQPGPMIVADAGMPEGGMPSADATMTGDAPLALDSGQDGGSSSDVGIDSGPETSIDSGPVASPGCGKPWTGTTGQWVSQPTGCSQGINNQGTAECQTIPPGATVVDPATSGSPERRGWWVLVPNDYDPNKAYPVIYGGAECGDSNWFHAGANGYPYQTVDNGQAILVGLDYDTFSMEPGGCPDYTNPNSSDITFVPWLMDEIERTLCVDKKREWMSGNDDAAMLAQQIDCVLPGRLRGEVMVAGGEPKVLPSCHPAPTAAMFVHDLNDTDQSYASAVLGCERILGQNGCSNVTCDPMDSALTTPYPVPSGVTLPPGAFCNQFVGCPADYPVVFCVTQGLGTDDGTDWGVTNLLWDFISGVRGVVQACTADTSTDPNNCGACGKACPLGQVCQGGSCGNPPSCAAGGAGMTNCAASGSESCCTSPEVIGGTFDRAFGFDLDAGIVGAADPATVSGFRLDKYDVTVGRFRQFVNAWDAGWLPSAGAGKHTHLNGGQGLANGAAPGTYELGWVPSDDDNVVPTSAHLACDPDYATWTPSAGDNENRPINCVDWYESYAFCIWDGGFLPSQAEWEYAAAGGNEQREYPWGATDPGTRNQYAIYNCCYPTGTSACTGVENIAPVGTATLGAGRWGQLDLASDVWQWTMDWSIPGFLDPCTDCASLSADTTRLPQGANFYYGTSYVLPSNNVIDTPTPPAGRYYFTGVRCARIP